jgi:hypothetical protein
MILPKFSIFIASLFLLLLVVGSTSPAIAAMKTGCEQTCVSVHREGGELVISARRDPVRIARPTTAPVASPTPAATRTTTPRKLPTKKRKPRPTFSDQVREVLPIGAFEIHPRSGALIYEPMLIRALGCADFQKKLAILDTSIELSLTPRIEWSWGDGSNQVWKGSATRGVHTYLRAGRYRIQMRCYWSGAFRTPNTSWAPIPEGITSSAATDVEIFRGRVFFTK